MPRTRYCRADDQLLLPIIEQICHTRPSNGYRRVTAHLNRHLKQHRLNPARVNPKRIYRIMKENQLLLTKAMPRCNDRTHEGQVIVPLSNTPLRSSASHQMALRSNAGVVRRCGSSLAWTVAIGRSSVILPRLWALVATWSVMYWWRVWKTALAWLTIYRTRLNG